MKGKVIVYVISFFLSTSVLLQGCAGAVVAGAAGVTAAAVSDERTVGQMVEDQAIEFKAIRALSEDNALSKVSSISPVSYNGILLLVGQTPNEKLKIRATRLVRDIEKVRSVHNHIELDQVITFKQRSRDAWLSTRIKSTVLSAQGLSGLNIKVVVKNEVLYLMGVVSRQEAAETISAARGVKGLRRIIQVFEYID